MFIDALGLFSDAQAITAQAASTNSVDLGSARNIGVGEDLYVAVNVDVAFTDAGSDSTLTVELQTDDDSAFGSPVTNTLFTIPAVTAAGAAFFAKIQPDQLNERYARLRFTPNNGNLTTGSVTAAFTKDIAKFIAYPKGYTIS